MYEWKMLNENTNYEINKNGMIRNKKTKRILKPAKNKTNGYLSVALCNNGKQKTYSVHKLVALNYIKNTNNYKEINHIDGNKENNNVSNLEWCDRSQNLLHAYNTGLKPKKYGKENLLSKKVKQTNLTTGETKIWNSLGEIYRNCGYSSGQISSVCNGIWKQAHGSKWEYI